MGLLDFHSADRNIGIHLKQSLSADVKPMPNVPLPAMPMQYMFALSLTLYVCTIIYILWLKYFFFVPMAVL